MGCALTWLKDGGPQMISARFWSTNGRETLACQPWHDQPYSLALAERPQKRL